MTWMATLPSGGGRHRYSLFVWARFDRIDHQFNNTCSNCSGSHSTHCKSLAPSLFHSEPPSPASRGWLERQRCREPLRHRLSGGAPGGRAKSRRCVKSPFSRSHSLSMMSAHLTCFGSSCSFLRRIEAAPAMLARGFRISWARPADSWPIAESPSTRFIPSEFACTRSYTELNSSALA
jgi:hypothetical protein